MASLRQLKDKKISVETINKITLSMESISISKSRKAIKELSNYKNYIDEFKEIYKKVVENSKFEKNNYDRTLWIVFTSDLGLAGGYSISIIRELLKTFQQEKDQLLIFGARGNSIILEKIDSSKIIYFSIEKLKDNDTLNEIVSLALNKFLDENMKINILYTEYINQITFNPKVHQILPIILEQKDSKSKELESFDFEPSATRIFDSTIDIYLYSWLIFSYKNSLASEHTARRVAMENASNNGEEILKNLKIEYNRKRQANITQEILEIIAGSEAIL